MSIFTSRRKIDEAAALCRRLHWLANMAIAKPQTAHDEFIARIAERARAKTADSQFGAPPSPNSGGGISWDTSTLRVTPPPHPCSAMTASDQKGDVRGRESKAANRE